MLRADLWLVILAILPILHLLPMVAGCGDDSAEGNTGASERSAAGQTEGQTAGAEQAGRGEPAAGHPGGEPEVDPLAEAFDVRLARVEPEAHLGEVRSCAVAFAEGTVAVGSRERSRYPVPAIRRVVVRCAADPGWGWADLIFTEDTAPQAERIQAGRMVRGRVVAPAGGFGDYTVLQFVEAGPTFDPPPPPEDPAAPEPAFDFGRAGDRGIEGSVQPCAVGFTGPIELVDDRDRRRHPYPEGASHRLAVKCLHEGGDAWIDLVFPAEEAPRALSVQRGATVPVRVESASGGYAGRPVTRLVTRPGEARP